MRTLRQEALDDFIFLSADHVRRVVPAPAWIYRPPVIRSATLWKHFYLPYFASSGRRSYRGLRARTPVPDRLKLRLLDGPEPARSEATERGKGVTVQTVRGMSSQDAGR
jgi:hypothetical protein